MEKLFNNREDLRVSRFFPKKILEQFNIKCWHSTAVLRQREYPLFHIPSYKYGQLP